MTQFDIDAETIRKLAELMTETDLSEIEMAQGDRSLRVSRASRTKHVEIAAPPAAPSAAAPPQPAPAVANPASHPGAVISPMVGTAYLQGEPGSPPFAAVGDTVRTGDTLLIIEAMKVMNPIKSPRGGTVMQVLISDGQPVEYGEPLMIIE
jgi:acetyl-CoA carboxylase biotin carboxyl carrier protein